MKPATRKLWDQQHGRDPNRPRLFAAVADAIDASRVLYAGSYVDVTPSFVFPSVTYVDSDRRAARFFADVNGVDEIISANQIGSDRQTVEFIGADYRTELPLAEKSFDLLVSLYAGFISEHCARYLRVGGTLLANSSHGDAAMASIDARFRLTAVIKSGGATGYRVDARELNTYLIPKKPQDITVEGLHRLGKGIGYTKSPFAYLFERVS